MAPTPLRILCFGDSLTSGFFSYGMESHPYSLKLEDKLTGARPDLDVRVVTSGVPGDVATFQRFIDRMSTECMYFLTYFVYYRHDVRRCHFMSSPPHYGTRCSKRVLDWVIVLAGTNDMAYGISPTSVYESLQKAWDIPLSKGSKVLALTVPECHARSEKLDKRRDELNRSIMTHRQPGYHSFDLKSHIPFHSLTESDREKYWDDGVHLRDDGYDWMGGHIADALLRLIGHDGQQEPATSASRRRSSKQTKESSSLAEETGNPRNISEGYVVVRKKDLD
ncbi:SGNH hydrolase-type esterase domain-containing protein [Dactylonectria macrodidyma]|uniref:SGNH hydrolase-type esterase domain-containing protein n=1 Tax=Dactylonectria macrodidyma TaxID=307937 RepID=A0A9P9JLM3_9HYPO|nr:SGNH hydrolase-type esterase domain-containing protein [Dactylonectria macrodidyma]